MTGCKKSVKCSSAASGSENVCMTADVLPSLPVHHGRLCPVPIVLDLATFGAVESGNAAGRP